MIAIVRKKNSIDVAQQAGLYQILHIKEEDVYYLNVEEEEKRRFFPIRKRRKQITHTQRR